MAKKKARTQEKQKLISLDGVRHDEIDRAAALAVMTGEQEKSGKGNPLLFISIDTVMRTVQEFFGQLKISVSDIKRRVERWMKHGWVAKVNDKFLVTQQGLPYINLLANAA